MELVKQYRETTFSQQIDTALTTEYLIIFFQMGHPRTLFVYFGSFQANFREKYVGFSRIWTWTVEVEGEHTNHLTSTTASEYLKFQA